MKIVRLQQDHLHHVNGKVIVHKAGATISVSDKVYNQIVSAIKANREAMRLAASKIPCTPEWKARNDR